MRSVSVCVVWAFLFFCPQLVSAQKQFQSEENQKHAPAVIKGKVVGQDGTAVEGAVVKFTLTSLDRSSHDWETLLDSQLATDENGQFQLSVKNTPAEDSELHLNFAVSSEMHFRRDFHFGNDKLWRETVDLGSLRISKGVRVTGQLVSPDSGIEVQGPVVNFVGRADGSNFYLSENCDDDGKFSCVVPAGSKLKLGIAANNFAYSDSEHEIKAPVGNSDDEIPEVDLGELKLKKGVSVAGSATLRNGRPASGIVVAIIERGSNGQLQVSSAKTDARGDFELPPHLGKCRLYVLEACRTRSVKNGGTETLKSDGVVPFFDPVDIDLDGKGSDFTVDLKEAESLTISGTISDAKGKPLAGQSVGYGWGSADGDFGMEGAIEMSYAKTNAKGEYSFQFGKGRRLFVQISNPDLWNDGFEFFVTKKTAFVCSDLFQTGSSRRLDEIEFNPIVKNATELNWEVQQTRSRSTLKRAGQVVDWLFQ